MQKESNQARIGTERQILGKIMADNTHFWPIYSILQPTDFEEDSNKKAFSAMHELAADKLPVDVVSLSERMKANGTFEGCGGVEYLSLLLEEAGSPEDCMDLARSIAPPSYLRGLVREVFLDLEQRFERNSTVIGLGTGCAELDLFTSGFNPGELVVIAGRPAQGKTAFAVGASRHICSRQDSRGIYFTTDDSKSGLLRLWMAQEAKVSLARMYDGKLSEREWSRLTKTAGELMEIRCHFSEKKWLSLGFIRSTIDRLKKNPPSFIVIDKFQSLIYGDCIETESQDRNYELHRIVVELKDLAKECGITVFIVSDVNKGVESRQTHERLLHDLRDNSGALESYADFVIMLTQYQGADRNQACCGYVNMVKSKRGPKVAVKMAWVPEYFGWENLASERN